MPGPERSQRSAETIAKARAMRAEHAEAAAYYAHRVEQARAAFHNSEVSHWSDLYRRSAIACRLLGELIRGDRPATTSTPDATVVSFAPSDAGEHVSSTGEAA